MERLPFWTPDNFDRSAITWLLDSGEALRTVAEAVEPHSGVALDFAHSRVVRPEGNLPEPARPSLVRLIPWKDPTSGRPNVILPVYVLGEPTSETSLTVNLR